MNLSKEIRIQAENVNFYYGDKQTLKNVNMSIFQNR
jgi:ABC-type phosphate transport system ATPase subunit